MTNKEAIKWLNKNRPCISMTCNKENADNINIATDMAIEALENKRPHGEWIVGEYMDCHSDILPSYTCPFCGEVEHDKYDFCHCGADMRGGDNE